MIPAYITLITAIIAIALWLISTYGEPFVEFLVDLIAPDLLTETEIN